jgi:hypothetical protein
LREASEDVFDLGMKLSNVDLERAEAPLPGFDPLHGSL